MRVVVVTTHDDPLVKVFWEAYSRAGGPPPAAVIFLVPGRRTALWRRGFEGILLFGLTGGFRAWRLGLRLRRILTETPQQVFGGDGEFHTFRRLSTGEGFQALQRMAPDLIVSAGSPEIFKPAVLQTASIGAVNVHNGRLPAYRGLFGTFWESFAGEAWGYTSIHVMEPGIDTGPVLAQGAVPLTGRSLIDALSAKKELGGRLLAWLVQYVEREGRLPPPRPDEAGVPSGYYSWPTLREMGLLKIKHLRRAIRRAPAPATMVETWPAGLAHGDQ